MFTVVFKYLKERYGFTANIYMASQYQPTSYPVELLTLLLITLLSHTHFVLEKQPMQQKKERPRTCNHTCFIFVHSLKNSQVCKMYMQESFYLRDHLLYTGLPDAASIVLGKRSSALQDKNMSILWFGFRGMRQKDFDFFSETKLNVNPPPDFFVLHLGCNDLGILPDLKLYQTIK